MAGPTFSRMPRLGAAVAIVVAAHALVLLYRPAPSRSGELVAAAPVMQVRAVVTAAIGRPPAPPSTPPQAELPTPAATPAPLPLPAAEPPPLAAAVAEPSSRPPAAERANKRPDKGAREPSPAASAALLHATAPPEPVAVPPSPAAETAPAPRAAAATPSLPAAPDYLLGARLDPGPRPLGDIEPVYPETAQLQEGSVVIRLLINEHGTVDNVAVVRAFPKGLFEQAAIDAFSRATFSPGFVLGTPVKSQMTVEVHFAPINRGARISGRGY